MTERRFQINPGPLRIVPARDAGQPEYRLRHYQAWAVACPRCLAVANSDCVRRDGSAMRGVHRERDLAFSRQQHEEENS